MNDKARCQRRSTSAMVTLLLLMLSAPCWAQTPEWNQLSREQQQLLAPLAGNWDGLDESRRERLLGGVERYLSMNAEERDKAWGRFRVWQGLDEEEKQHIRQQFERFGNMDAKEQERLRERFERFQQLPEERRKALRNDWQSRRDDRAPDRAQESDRGNAPDSPGRGPESSNHPDRGAPGSGSSGAGSRGGNDSPGSGGGSHGGGSHGGEGGSHGGGGHPR